MAEIQSIRPAVVAPRQTNPEVVERLTALLEMAQRGEVQSIAYVALRDDDCIATNWTSGTSNWKLVAAVSKLWHRVMRWDEQREAES